MILQSPVEFNYCALCVCILSNRLPDEAFQLMEITPEPKRLDDAEIQKLIDLKHILTWKQIGDMYGLTPDGAYQRVKRFKKRQEKLAIWKANIERC